MINLKNIAGTLLLLLFACQQGDGKSKETVTPYAEYLAGLHLIQGNKKIPRYDEQAMRLEQLKKVTGIDAEEMITYLSTLKNQPEKAMELYKEMVQLTTDTIETTDTVTTNKN